MAKKPKIAFLGTGGTISYTGRNSLDVWEYMDFGTRLSVTEILSRFPEVEESADKQLLEVFAICSSPSIPHSQGISEVARIGEHFDVLAKPWNRLGDAPPFHPLEV